MLSTEPSALSFQALQTLAGAGAGAGPCALALRPVSKPLLELGTGLPPALLTPTLPQGEAPLQSPYVTSSSHPASAQGHLGSCAGCGSPSLLQVKVQGPACMRVWVEISRARALGEQVPAFPLPSPQDPEDTASSPASGSPQSLSQEDERPWTQRPLRTQRGSWVSGLADVTRPKSSAAVPCQREGSEGQRGTDGSSSARTVAIHQEISSGRRQSSGRSCLQEITRGHSEGTGHRRAPVLTPGHPGPRDSPTPGGGCPSLNLAVGTCPGRTHWNLKYERFHPMTLLSQPHANPRGTQASPPEAASAWLPPEPATSWGTLWSASLMPHATCLQPHIVQTGKLSPKESLPLDRGRRGPPSGLADPLRPFKG